jgi:hypothetical protein
MRTRTLALALSVLAASAIAKPAEGGERIAIAVVVSPGDRFGARLVAELELLGFRAIVVDPAGAGASPPAASRESLEAAARDADAAAAIRAVPSAHGVEVWIADRVTGKTVLREMSRDDGAANVDGVLAVRAVELLRASLLEASMPDAPRGEVERTPALAVHLQPPPPRIAALAPAPTTVRFGVGGALLASGGGFGPAASLAIDVAWMPTERIGLDAFTAIPLTRPSIASGGNRADLSALMAGGALRIAFASRASAWTPSADLGLSVVSLRSTGTATTGFVSSTSSAISAAPFIGAGLAFAATPTFRLRAELRAAVVTRSVSVEFANQRVASWGAPVIVPELGGDFGWF